MRVLVQRSRVRPTVAFIVGILAVVAALDIAAFGVVYPEPERDEATGELTNDGKAERRGDITWGVALGVGGLALAAWGVRGRSGNRRLLAADDERIVAAIGPPGAELWSVGWNEVFAVRSTVDDDETGMTRALDIELAHDSLAPTDPRGARVEGEHVLIDAEDWNPSLDWVVGRLQVLLDRARA
jgi:hypothetical protein